VLEHVGTSLRGRIAVWMAAAAVFTALVFASTMYFVVRAEGVAVAEVAEELLWALVVAVPLTVLVAFAGASWLARRALVPLEGVIRTAHEISAQDLHRRLPVPARSDELASLVEALNDLLARLDDGFEALGRSAADASHELRTPVASLATELEVALRRSRTTAEWEAVARRSLAELRRLAVLLDELLAFAKARDEAIRGRTAIDVREQVDLVLAALGRDARDRGLLLSPAAEGGDAPAWIVGSADAISTVIRNLVENALHHTPRDGVILAAVATEGQRVIIDVEDSGVGIAASEREEVFLPFRRGVSADRSRSAGFGLGLAIARRVVEAHGGRISVDDSVLGGARFRVELPRTA
jgi:signal transduction histidine kinase